METEAEKLKGSRARFLYTIGTRRNMSESGGEQDLWYSCVITTKDFCEANGASCRL